MPVLRILSDVNCSVVIDDMTPIVVERNKISSLQITKGTHLFQLKCVYSDVFTSSKLLQITDDLFEVFNFSQTLRQTPTILSCLELFRFTKDGKYGFFEPITRSVIIPPIYDDCTVFSKDHSDYAIVTIDARKGIIDKCGRVVVPIQYDDIEVLSTNRFIVTDNNRKGVLDNEGRIVIPLEYERIEQSPDKYRKIEGFVLYSHEAHPICTDLNGERLAWGPYEEFSIERLSDGNLFVLVKKNGKMGVVSEGNKTLVDFNYDQIIIFHDLFEVMKGNGPYGPCVNGLINAQGDIVLECAYDNLREIYTGEDDNRGLMLRVCKDGKTGVCKKDGSEILPIKYNDIGYSVIGSRFLAINSETGHQLFDLDRGNSFAYEYERIQDLSPNWIDLGEDEDFWRDKTGAYKYVAEDNKCGLIYPSFSLQKPDCIYDNIYCFYHNFACVEQNGKFGAINRSGETIVPCIYDKPFCFSSDGYAKVFLTTDYTCCGLIDSTGRSILGFMDYQEIEWSFWDSRKRTPAIIAIRGDNKRVLLDFCGNVLSSSYDIIQKDGIVRRSGKYGCLNSMYQESIPCSFEKIESATSRTVWCKKEDRYSLFKKEDGTPLTGFDYYDHIDYLDGYVLARRASGWGIISEHGRELCRFVYEPFDLIKNAFYRGYTLDDMGIWGYDEYGDPFIDACHESFFRYGIARLPEGSFIDENGEFIALRNLGDALF